MATKTKKMKVPDSGDAGFVSEEMTPYQIAPTKTGLGLVRSYFFESPSLTRPSPTAIVGFLRAGLPVEELDVLQAALGVSKGDLADILGISRATFHRRQGGQLLGRDESDRVVRFARLMGKAIEVFESEESARQWLNSPQAGLGGEVPLAYAQTEVGAREVENLLGRIEYGVYS